MMASIPHDLLAMGAAGLGVAIFVYGGIVLFQKGWGGYEERYVSGAEKTLDSMYLTMPAQHILYLAFLAAAVLGMLGILISGPILALPFALIGLSVPRIILWVLKRQRDQRFVEQLVDSLMNVSNSLKAGLTLPQAFESLSREMPNPMRQEMRLLCQELRLGVDIDDALQHLLRRMPSDDLDLVVTAVTIVRDVGGNLTEVFDNIAHTIRERFRIEGKINALTAQGKMQAVVICLLPFVLLGAVNVFSPGFTDPLFETVLGGGVLLLGIVIMAAGMLWIRKIITIKV
ncbi:MAG: type II secretion system F family protein [Planctomycetota bacterium]|jgi:tight adherence protein B